MSKGRRISKRSTRRYQRDFRSNPIYQFHYASKVLPTAIQRAMDEVLQRLAEAAAALNRWRY